MNQKSFFSAKREARSAKRAQAREALEVWRICEPRSGSNFSNFSNSHQHDNSGYTIDSHSVQSTSPSTSRALMLKKMHSK